jgi:D-alanyl-D-alanine carboxypeptidase
MRDSALVLVSVTGALLLGACAKPTATRPLDAFASPSPPPQTSTQAGDGYIPEGQSISPFDKANPAIANLDPHLRSAMQQAAQDAGNAGVQFWVNSGWRSPKYQQRLLDRAIVKYGSEATARRYVSTPEKSAHVKGEAVDIGPTNADSWLAQHGSEYGLCQTYGNEMWHYELRTTPGGTCPAMIADASGG